jgi:hypothetical protein
VSTAAAVEAPTTFRKSVFWTDSQTVSASTLVPLTTDYYNTIDTTASHYYALKFTHRAGLRAYLDQMYGNVDLQLIQDRNGNGKVDKADVLITSNRTRTKTDYINTVLDPGIYFVRVFSTTAISPYHLKFTATTAPASDPGSSMATAFDLGSYEHFAGSQKTYMNSMSISNRRDYYKINIIGIPGGLVMFDSLVGDVNVQFIQDTNGNGLPDDGETIDTSSNPGSANDSINISHPGVFFIRVYRASDGPATYQFKIGRST